MTYSIVIPIYLREEDHIDIVVNTLDNIRALSTNYELIVVDDGSPLDTSFIKKYVDKLIRHKTNKGISASWNTGKNKAKGEYVAIVNDDIEVPINWLAALAYGFTNEKTGVTAPMVGGPYVKPQVAGSDDIVENHKFYPGYCFMLKRDRFFEDFDNQFTTNCGDTDYWHRIRQAGLDCMRINMSVWHKEGGVLHGMNYDKISRESTEKFIKKWGFDPKEEYYT